MSAATWILFSKFVLISTGAISIAMAIGFSVPSIMAFAFYDVPTIWSTLVSWFKPPYLYFIVNGIIITIAASSRFSQKAENLESTQAQPLISARALSPAHVVAATIPVQSLPEIKVVEAPPELAYDAADENEAEIVEQKSVVVNGIIEAADVLDDNDDLVISKSTYSPPEGDDVDDGDVVFSKSACTRTEKIISPEVQLDYFVFPVQQKPLLPPRFGHRKPIKVIPDGGSAVRVARPNREESMETLESTWKMIMEGRQRQLKKSDTFKNHGRHLDVNALDNDDLLPQQVLKSETFRDRTNYGGDGLSTPAVPALGWSSNMRKIKKELSLSKDELNRRVEAFIKKFNEDMKLQRQESLKQYMEMINPVAN